MSSSDRPTTSNPLLAQAVFQALYHITKQETESKEASGQHSHPAEATKERFKPPAPKPEPKCDAEATNTKLLNDEFVDISSWRAEHMELAKRHPRQHQDCPRILWKIVDFIEQRESEVTEKSTLQPPSLLGSDPSPSASLVRLLMHDVYALSQNHDFLHANSGRKLATLVDPIEAVAIHRELLQRDSAGFDSDSVLYLERALGHMSDEISTLRERIALTRQLLVLEPRRTTSIRRLAYLLMTLYDRTSEDTAFYEARSLQDELIQRGRKEECPVMDRIEAEWRENSAFEDVEFCVVQHISLVQVSPNAHVSCSSRLLTLVEDIETSFRRIIKSEDEAALVREAVRLVDRGIGISEQLRALNALYRVLRKDSPDQAHRLALLTRLRPLVFDTRHRIAALSWLGEHRSTQPQSSQDSLTLVWDAVARVESETMPGLQWLNRELLTFNEHHRRPDMMTDFQDQFKRAAFKSGNFEDMPENSPQKAHSLTMYAMTILGNSRPEHANMVIQMLHDAARSWGLPPGQPVPPGHPMRGTLMGLANAYYMRHWWFGQAEDIEAAVDILKYTMAGAFTKDDHMPILGPLCAALEAKYRRLGEVKDTLDALALASLFYSKLPEHVETLQIAGLRQWAKAADCLFDALGDTALLDQAARRARQALRLTTTGHPLLPVLLSLLGSVLRKRFLYLQMPQDLTVSENFTKLAVQTQEASNSVDQDLPNNRALYAETMLVKFRQDSNPEWLETALSNFKKILDEGNDHDANRADANYWYGNALCIRNQGDDLVTAIAHLRKALAIQPDTRHSRYPLWASGLSNALVTYFRTTGDHTTLDEAMSLSELATSLLPDTSAIRADIYAQLAETRYQKFEWGHSPEDLESCIAALEKAALSEGSPRPRRLLLTQRWEDIAVKHNHLSLSRALGVSLKHQNKIVGLGKSVKFRHEYLAKNPSVASRAAARAIRQGSLEFAVECLERGRSILWRQTLELRVSLEQLKNVSPSLANQLAAVVEELDESERLQTVSGPFSVTLMDLKDPDRILQYQRELSEQYDLLLEQIRALDGLSNFLRPFEYSDTIGIASDGPVVLLNLCDEGCDALVLLHSGVHHVPLPDADFETLSARRAALMTAAAHVMYDEGTEMDAILPPLLRMLWVSLVEPVVSFIKASGTAEKRVFWCVAGLSDLPIHAAGPYKAGQRGLPDTFISSYTPTLSALIRARESITVVDTPQPRLLAISQTETDGMSELPFALEEISILTQLDIITTELSNDKASLSSVLSELETHNWVHLCCHGTTNAKLPLLSAFHIAKSRLTIESLMRAELPVADFAFLSACHTAEGSEAQNENMSLASALQVTGFRSIVATMYAIADSDGPAVSRELYEYMFRDRSQRANSSDAALGLNKAVRKLRQAKAPMHRWVPFIHIGA
ncbi:CHAT domain-containing protein [Rhizoctonia solani]|nr:CHAT domain-containing protein [Rhizoctonia solani]